MQGSSM